MPTVVIIKYGILSSQTRQPLKHDRDGATKGVIAHSPSANDQLARRIIGVLDSSPQPSHSTDASGAPNGAAVFPNTVPPVENGDGSEEDSSDQTSHGRRANGPDVRMSEATEQELRSRPNDNHGPVEEVAGHEPSHKGVSETAGTAESASKSGRLSKPTVKSTPQQDWTRLRRERERKEREERDRIRARIKSDRDERRRMDEQQRQFNTEVTDHRSSKIMPEIAEGAGASEVRVQVRTFDGSTLRSRFEKEAKIASQVRPWIDSLSQTRMPYNLKIILTPRPNRTIEAAEEQKSLEELDIIGSCTMVMVPVQGFVDSYSPAQSGLIGSMIAGGYHIVSGSLGAVLGGVRSVLGFGDVRHEGPATGDVAPASAPDRQVRVRTLADQRIEARQQDHQFYNGNQLNFEPRKKDAEEQEDKGR